MLPKLLHHAYSTVQNAFPTRKHACRHTYSALPRVDTRIVAPVQTRVYARKDVLSVLSLRRAVSVVLF